jgi:hypothetical protein
VAGNKTQPSEASVASFLNSIEDKDRRADCKKVAAMMRAATGARAKMWGATMVGYGRYHYKYASGREGEYFLTGFSPRKNDLTLYIMPGFSGFASKMKELGKHRTGKSCLYIKRLADVDEQVLERLIVESVRIMREKHETS